MHWEPLLRFLWAPAEGYVALHTAYLDKNQFWTLKAQMHSLVMKLKGGTAIHKYLPTKVGGIKVGTLSTNIFLVSLLRFGMHLEIWWQQGLLTACDVFDPWVRWKRGQIGI